MALTWMGGGIFSAFQNQFRAADGVFSQDFTAPFGKGPDKPVARVGIYVFVGVGSRGQPCVEPFDQRPLPAPIIRRAQDQHASGFQYPETLVDMMTVFVRYMLDDFRGYHRVERRVSERQGHTVSLHKRSLPHPTAHEAQFIEADVHADRPVEIREEPTAAAADVADQRARRNKIADNAPAFALPVALQGDDAIVGAPVIVRELNGPADAPFFPDEPQVFQAEGDQPGVRRTGFSGLIVERHLRDGIPLLQREKQQFNQHREVLVGGSQGTQGFGAVEPKTARKIPGTQLKQPPENGV